MSGSGPTPRSKGARAGRAVVAVALGLFAVAAAARLNPFCLLEPDSPGYLFEAKSLASFDGYSEIDHAGHPPHTFRPPGLSLLLVPTTWIAPLAVVPAKIVVLALSVLALVLIATLAAREPAPPWGAAAATLIVASSPYSLLHATEVVTEFPYLACATAVVLLVSRGEEDPSRGVVASAAALLAFLPFLRTIGLALVAAVALWILLDRRRRAFWPAPVAAAGATALWMARNAMAGGPTYFGAIVSDVHRLGWTGYLAKVADATGFYSTRVFEVLLPGFWPGRPMYERVLVGGAADLGGLHGAAWIAGIAVVALAALGAAARWRRDGALLTFYAALFFGVLAIYPPRHERLTWPLVPIVWSLVPSGWAALKARLAGSRYAARAAGAVAATACAALVAWQGSASLAMARDNLSRRSGGEAFYATRIPPIYFADWPAAGRWLRDHAPAGSKVLTRHSDVGFASGLVQESARFEELPPAVWRGRIARTAARYLIVPTSLFGKFFPMDLLRSDPTYSYERVFEGRDVAVLEVRPNLTGLVQPPEDLGPTRDRCEAAAAREPHRVDIAVRCAELDADSGRPERGAKRLRDIVDRGEADVRIEVALGRILLDAGKDEEAAAAFAEAARLPEAELLEQTIERGRRAAEQRAAARSLDKHVRARLAAARARDFMDELRWGDAYREIDEALVFDPADPEVLATAGDFMLHVGRNEDAANLYGSAGGRGDSVARAKGEALRAALAAESWTEAPDPRSYGRAARFFAGEGMPGRALALLRKASERFPADAEISRLLADVSRFYGLEVDGPH